MWTVTTTQTGATCSLNLGCSDTVGTHHVFVDVQSTIMKNVFIEQAHRNECKQYAYHQFSCRMQWTLFERNRTPLWLHNIGHPCALTLVVSKEANPISFIISISSSVLPCMSSAVKTLWKGWISSLIYVNKANRCILFIQYLRFEWALLCFPSHLCGHHHVCLFVS